MLLSQSNVCVSLSFVIHRLQTVRENDRENRVFTKGGTVWDLRGPWTCKTSWWTFAHTFDNIWQIKCWCIDVLLKVRLEQVQMLSTRGQKTVERDTERQERTAEQRRTERGRLWLCCLHASPQGELSYPIINFHLRLMSHISHHWCAHTQTVTNRHTHTERERASVRFQWSPSKWTPQSTLPHDSCAVTVVFKPCIANNVCWPRAVRSSVGLEGFSWCASGWWNKASFYQRVTLFSCLLLTDESLSLPFSAPISCSSCVQWLFLQALMRLIKQPDLCRSDWSVVVVRWSEASGRFIFLVWSCSTWASRQWDTIRSISIWMETWMSREDTGPRPSSAIFPSTTHSPAA